MPKEAEADFIDYIVHTLAGISERQLSWMCSTSSESRSAISEGIRLILFWSRYNCLSAEAALLCLTKSFIVICRSLLFFGVSPSFEHNARMNDVGTTLIRFFPRSKYSKLHRIDEL